MSFSPSSMPRSAPTLRSAAPIVLRGAHPTLDAETLKRASQRLFDSYAPNSRRAFAGAFAEFTLYCLNQRAFALPCEPACLIGYVERLVERGLKRASIEVQIAAISAAHLAADLPNPRLNSDFRAAWKRLCRERLSKRQKQARALTWDDIRVVLAVLDPKLRADLRDAALVCVAYDAMLRRSELVSLEVADIEREADGSGRLLLKRSKVDQEGAGALLYLAPPTMLRINAWLNAAQIDHGAIFRTLKGNQRKQPGGALNPATVREIFRRLSKKAGIPLERISGHSTRVGATQDLLAAHIGRDEIKRAGRWKSDVMIVRYGANLDAGRSGMAALAKVQRRAC